MGTARRMRVFLGTDHAGFALKERLRDWLVAAGHDVVDCGATAYDADDDYPPYVVAAVGAAVARPDAVAIVLGGSGNGEAIVANKVPGARAAVCWSPEIARLAREHNDANVCSLGARFVTDADARAIVEAFLATPFSGDPRHVRRLAQVAAYEGRSRGAAGPDSPD